MRPEKSSLDTSYCSFTASLWPHDEQNLLLSGVGGEAVTKPLLKSSDRSWVVTSLNLLPIGQLDGGHVIYAVFASKSRFVAATAFGGLALVAIFMSPAYIFFVVLLWIFRIKHPPTMNDFIQLDQPRQVVAAGLLLVFILCFTPVPIVKMPF